MSGFIHATLPRADAERRPYESGNHARYQLSEEDLLCFDCPLPDCDPSHPLCVFNSNHAAAKRVYDLAHKAAQREVDEAVARIVAEREAG